MSDLTYQPERHALATKIESEIREIKYKISQSYLIIGKNLKTIRDEKLYLELGHDTVTDWLKSPDISISPTWAFNIIALYEFYIVEQGLPEEKILEIDYTKLHDMMPVVRKDPSVLDDWMDKAKTLRRVDLQRELREYQVIEKRNTYIPPTVQNKQIIHGDALIELPKMEFHSADAIITDPPKFIPKHESRIEADSELAVDYGWIVDFHITWMTEAMRVLKDDGVFVIMVNQHNLFPIGHAMKDIGLYIIRDIIWEIPTVNQAVSINSLIPAHETIIWSRKGNTHVCNLTDFTRDVWQIPLVKKYNHPSEKPEFLVEKLIDMTTDLGQTIIDPFAGSGTVLSVANRMSRQYVGIEKDINWYRICQERLSNG